MRRGVTAAGVEAPASRQGSPPTQPRDDLTFSFFDDVLGLPYHSEASSSGGQQARCLSEVLKHGEGTRGSPAPEIPPCGLSSLPHWFF